MIWLCKQKTYFWDSFKGFKPVMRLKGSVLQSSLLLILLFVSFVGIAQETTHAPERKGRPDIPGSFVLEFGFNQPLSKPDSFDIGFWGSRTLNFYYQYELKFGESSKFSLLPGIGLSMERYKLKNDSTLVYQQNGTISTVGLESAWNEYPGVRKSMVVTNYLEIPIELRFTANPGDPGRSFKASLGARFGYLYDSYTKIKYDPGELKKIKDKQSYFMNDFRTTLFAKFGGGNFSLFCYYSLTPLFESGKGPEQKDMRNLTFGISLSSF